MQPPLPLPALSDNYIWLFHPGAGETWLVDPGDDRVVRQVLQRQSVDGVLITHHHPDHIAALPRLLDAGVPRVIAPQDPRIALATERVADGDRIRCGEVDFEVWATPGHTLSHVCYVGADTLFCGDTLFSLGCGRLFEGSATQMLDSLDRIAGLPDTTVVCPTHEYTESNLRFALRVEPDNRELSALAEWVADRRRHGRPTLPTDLARERRCNPFLRSRCESVRRTLAARASQSPHSDADWFALLRQWKDQAT